MKTYQLYLDESETHVAGSNRVFCIAGIIVDEDDHTSILQPALDDLKKKVWSDLPSPTSIVLHQKDVSFAQNNNNRYKLNQIPVAFHRFRSNIYSRTLYQELEKIFDLKATTVIGSCIIVDELQAHFNNNILSDKYLIGMQILFENFCHFLSCNNARGSVFLESREEAMDKEIRMRFNHIKAMGTMYINPYAIQRHLQEIHFPAKQENLAGLQMADFIPNTFARKACGKDHKKFNIYDALRKNQYDGNLMKQARFGVKVMP